MTRQTDYIKTTEAAKILGVAKNTLRKWAATGKILVQRDPATGYRRFKRSDLETFLGGVVGNHLPPTSAIARPDRRASSMSPVVEFFSALLIHHKQVEDSRIAAIWKKAAELVLDDIQAQLAKPADDRGQGQLLKQREKVLVDFVSGTTVSPPQLYSKDDYLASIVKDHCPQAKIDLVDEEIDDLPFLSETPWEYALKHLQDYDSRLTTQAIESYLVTRRTPFKGTVGDDIGVTLHNLHHRGLIGEVLDQLRDEYPGLRDSLWEAWQRIGNTLQIPEPAKPARQKTSPKATVNQRMSELIIERHDTMGWNSTQWAKFLKCAASTVVATTVWKELETFREMGKAELRKDRRRKPKASDQRRD